MSLRQQRLVLVLTKEYSAWTIKMSSSFAKNGEGVNAGIRLALSGLRCSAS